MQMISNKRADFLRGAVASYAEGIYVPKLDDDAIAARRGNLSSLAPPPRRLVQTATLAAAAVLAIFATVDASAVVAAMQRVVSAFAVIDGRTLPVHVRVVELAKARADAPFEIIVPPAFPGATMTLREIFSSASTASNSVIFDVHLRQKDTDFSIVESRDVSGTREIFLSARETDREDAEVAPLRAVPKVAPGALHASVIGDIGKGSFVPLTWVTHGTRIVLMSPPGALSDARMRAIRSKMSY